MNLSLLETLQAQLAAQGHLVSTEALLEAIQASLKGQGKETPLGSGKVTVVATMASFQVVTPSGGCGSLPAVIHCRTSGADVAHAAMNGLDVTLTYNGTVWQGTKVVSGQSEIFTVGCNSVSHLFYCAVSGGFASYGSSASTLSGTGGASPNLTGTLPGVGATTGSLTVAITRT